MVSMRPGSLKRLFSWSADNNDDPFRSASAADRWLADQDGKDIAERAYAIGQLLAEPRAEQEATSRSSLEALWRLDGGATPVSDALIRRYVAGVEHRDARATSAWTTAFDLTQALCSAYRPWLAEAETGGRNADESYGQSAARYLHWRAVERRLRTMRYEQWIPGKWRELYAAFEIARRLGAERRVYAAPGGGTWPSAENELVWTLLYEILHRGSFGVSEIEWATRYLRRWLPDLQLSTTGDRGVCWVDVGSTSGLRRPIAEGSLPAGMLFLDIRPVVARLQSRMSARPRQRGARYTSAAPAKLVSVLDSYIGGRRARAERVPSQASARVVAGLDATLVNLAFSRRRRRDATGIEMGYELRRPLSRFVELNWPPPGSVPAGGLAVIGHIRDVSETGLRIALPTQQWGVRSTGELIGVQEAESLTWKVGVARRLLKPRSDSIEIGIELLTASPAWVRLTDAGTIEPVAQLTRGEAADAVYGMYVPPGRLRRPALVIAPANWRRGRRLMMTTPHAAYELSLSAILERGIDWLLAVVEVLAKTPLPGAAGGPDSTTPAG